MVFKIIKNYISFATLHTYILHNKYWFCVDFAYKAPTITDYLIKIVFCVKEFSAQFPVNSNPGEKTILWKTVLYPQQTNQNRTRFQHFSTLALLCPLLTAQCFPLVVVASDLPVLFCMDECMSCRHTHGFVYMCVTSKLVLQRKSRSAP